MVGSAVRTDATTACRRNRRFSKPGTDLTIERGCFASLLPLAHQKTRAVLLLALSMALSERESKGRRKSQ